MAIAYVSDVLSGSAKMGRFVRAGGFPNSEKFIWKS